MFKSKLIWFVTFLALAGSAWPAHAQGGARSGFYQISSGRFTACCGFAGTLIYPLPNASQKFVELIVDPNRNTAQMTFLGDDLQTVLSIFPGLPGSGFSFSFSDGIVFPDHIQFGDPLPLPPPRVPYWSYSVSNSADELLINGVAVTPLVGADLPNHFEHTNVSAKLVQAPVRIDRVERDGDSMRFHFTGRPPFNYTVDFSDSLTPTNWTPLAVYQAKIQSIDVVVTNLLTNVNARFYRVRQEPCFCR